MGEFANVLRIGFFQGNEPVSRKEDNKHSVLSDNNSLYLNLSSEKDKTILELIMKCDILHIENDSYKVLGREFMLDGTALFVNIEKLEK